MFKIIHCQEIYKNLVLPKTFFILNETYLHMEMYPAGT